MKIVWFLWKSSVLKIVSVLMLFRRLILRCKFESQPFLQWPAQRGIQCLSFCSFMIALVRLRGGAVICSPHCQNVASGCFPTNNGASALTHRSYPIHPVLLADICKMAVWGSECSLRPQIVRNFEVLSGILLLVWML